MAGIYTYADEFVVVISDQTTGSGLRAVQLASQIKALHANVIFMVYGINPEYGSSIDILINRITCFYRGAMEHLFLAHVLCSIVEDTTPESLKKQFTSLDLCNA
ncbi:hypothetical protein KKE33_02555 [Patescibacteria group bacterium]|nr:hypothetical protein [Patescibacteria group bacterium]